MTTDSLPRVSVIIVNWNGCHHLAACLDSLQNQTLRDFEVVLVDNGSDDGSIGFVCKHYPWVRLVELDENTGFARGNNLGMAAAVGVFLVTLNNDTRVDPDWLKELVVVADSDSAIGMVGSRICRYNEPDLLDSLSVAICFDGMSRGVPRGRRFADLGCATVEPILLPSACAALYKREMIAEIGFFDEDFFAYCEDTDLGLRGRLAGWGAVVATKAIVLHKYSQTGGAISPFKLRLVERNHYWVVLKNFPTPLLILIPFATLLRFIHQALAFVQGNWRRPAVVSADNSGAGPLLYALLSGMSQAIAGYPTMIARRRRVQAMRRISIVDFGRLLRQYHLSFRELFEDAS